MYLHLHGGVTPESTSRFEAAADRLYDLQGRLAEYGGRLVLAPLESTLFHERLLQFVRARGAGIPVLEGMTHIRAEHRLDDNRHTNGVFNRAAAWRFAEFLLDEGWVPGGVRSQLPPESELYRDNRRTPASDAESEAQVREIESLAAASIGPRIDLEDGTGCKQVYGGIWPDGGVGISFLAALSNEGGRTLRLEVERPRRQTGVYPLELEVEVNGVSAGAIALEPRGPEARVVHDLELPPEVADAPFLDVLVVSSAWVQESFEGIRRLHAYDFVSLELVR